MAEHDLPYELTGQEDDTEDAMSAYSVAQMLPDFTAAVRGYDRAQVDDYVTRLHELLADAEERARMSEAAHAAANEHVQTLNRQLLSAERQSGAPTPRSVTTYVDRMKEIVMETVDTAQKFKDDAYDEAEGIRLEATEEGRAILSQAKVEAGQLLGAAQSEERSIRQQIEELITTRERLVAELVEMQNQLSQLLRRPLPAERADVERPDHGEITQVTAPAPVNEEPLGEAEDPYDGDVPLFDQEA